MRYSYGVSKFAIYEDGKEYYGVAEVQLPEITYKTGSIKGAGISGETTVPYIGHLDPMEITINFIDASESAYKLQEPHVHKIHLLAAHDVYDSEKHEHEIDQYKHILYIEPLSFTSGTVAPASKQDASGKYTCLVRKDYFNGKCMLEYDPLNNVLKFADGNNVLDAIEKAIGH